MASLPDALLAARAAAGEAAAFGELARRHGTALRLFLRRMGASPALADDLAQDAFVTAFRRSSSLADPSAFLPWIKQIAARLYIRRWRGDARLDLFAEAPEPEVGAVSKIQADHADRLDMETAMAGLVPAQRICLSLCYGAGLSQAEAAGVLNLSQAAVKSHVKRGLRQLRLKMGAEEAGSSAS